MTAAGAVALISGLRELKPSQALRHRAGSPVRLRTTDRRSSAIPVGGSALPRALTDRNGRLGQPPGAAVEQAGPPAIRRARPVPPPGSGAIRNAAFTPIGTHRSDVPRRNAATLCVAGHGGCPTLAVGFDLRRRTGAFASARVYTAATLLTQKIVEFDLASLLGELSASFSSVARSGPRCFPRLGDPARRLAKTIDA